MLQSLWCSQTHKYLGVSLHPLLVSHSRAPEALCHCDGMSPEGSNLIESLNWASGSGDSPKVWQCLWMGTGLFMACWVCSGSYRKWGKNRQEREGRGV